MENIDIFLESLKKIPNLDINKLLDCYKKEKSVGIRFNIKKLSENLLITKKGKNLQYDLCQLLNNNNVSGNIKQIPWCKNGFYYLGQDRPGKSILHELGAYYLQEPSAMAPVEFLDVKENSIVLDLCASPGGKSTQIAEKLNSGFLIANEIVTSRAKTLVENIERLGIDNTIVLNHSPKDLEKRFENYFDRILVDAPCSGEGMFRKNEKAINEWTENTPHICANRQKEIVESAYKMLAPNGKMVYSTCTFSLEENEEVIKFILDNHPDMKILPLKHETFKFEKGVDIDGTNRLTNCARLYPYNIDGEGHFFAVLQKQSIIENKKYQFNQNIYNNKIINIESRKNSKFNSKNIQNIKIFNDFAKNYNIANFENFTSFGETIYANCPINLDGLKVLCAGVKLGEIKKNIFMPSWHFAHCLSKTQFNNVIDLDLEETKNYIQGYEINKTCCNRWALITYFGLPLAFGKCVTGKIKNHYPKNLRKTL